MNIPWSSWQHLLLSDLYMPVTFHCPIFSFSKLDSSSYDLKQSSEYLRYLSEAVVSIRNSNTYSLMRRGAAVLLREVVLANQNLSECSISVTAGKSRRVSLPIAENRWLTSHQEHFLWNDDVSLMLRLCLWLVTEVPAGVWIRGKFKLEIDR